MRPRSVSRRGPGLRSGPDRSSQPATAPGVAFSTRSTTAEGRWRLQARGQLVDRKLQAEHQQQEHDADRAADLDELPGGGHRCDAPSPRTRPASRYSGTGVRANRRASPPSPLSTAKMRPSSSRQGDRGVHRTSGMDDPVDAGDPLGGADDDQDVPGLQRLTRCRRSDHVIAPDDRRRSTLRSGFGPGSHQGGGRRTASRARSSICPALSPGTSLGQVGEPFGDPGRAEELRVRVGLLDGAPQIGRVKPGSVRSSQTTLEVACPASHVPLRGPWPR